MDERVVEWVLKGQRLLLLPEKAIFWVQQKILIVSDLHIGKVGHFRKAGIAIPKLLEQEELSVLTDLIEQYKPGQIIFLGDLFHSEHNDDWNWLVLWCGLFPEVEMILVKGNHDILHPDYYANAGFKVFDELVLAPFKFTHEPEESDCQGDFYCISGHIHPAVKLRGAGRQSTVLSCFYFKRYQAIMPAFGRFTGKYCLEADESAEIFGVLGSKVLHLNA
ncbi:ligase-associated DNA damage response endonuclease PdeM [Arcticibacter sp.]|uniref:ligase-associated DNA damage response endonuclease PdeM n=1 Tax=Arcticibacter sp. TaxID=1872630 RepID=UPI00388D85B1